MWRGESHFSQKWRLANVGESGEYSVNGLANVGEFGESAQHGLANVCESGESAQHDLANVCESGESAQHGLANVGESGESRIFQKTAVLASTRTRQKRRVLREYSNSLNSPASSHCLLKMQLQKCNILMAFFQRSYVIPRKEIFKYRDLKLHDLTRY
jgi:hypothetical protein